MSLLTKEIEKTTIQQNKGCDDSLGNVLYITGLPITDNIEKLELFLKERLLKNIKIVNMILLSDPKIPTKTNGAAIFHLETEEAGKEVQKMLDNLRIDKLHKLRCISFNSIGNLHGDGELSYVGDDKRERIEINKNISIPLLEEWLINTEDEFFVQCGSTVHFFADRIENEVPSLSIKFPERTVKEIKWSPRGNYLAVFDLNKIELRCGKKSEEYSKIEFAGVTEITFSPNEKYLVTKSITPDEKEHASIWLNSPYVPQLLRQIDIDESGVFFIDWSFDDTAVGILHRNILKVYDISPADGYEHIKAIMKKSFEVPSAGFMWSPYELKLLYWAPAKEQFPLRITIANENGGIVKVKNMFNSDDCRIFWEADYVGCLVTKKNIAGEKLTNIEIFYLKERGIPIETKEYQGDINLFVWQPKGSRFIITGEDTNGKFLTQYLVEKAEVNRTKEIRKKQIEAIAWSSDGEYWFYLATDLIRETVDIFTEEGCYIGIFQPKAAKSVEWCPSGNYILSYSNTKKTGNNQTDYSFWSLSGKRLLRRVFPEITFAQCRPRPDDILTDGKKKELKSMAESEYSQTAIVIQPQISFDEEERNWAAWKASRKGRYQTRLEKKQETEEWKEIIINEKTQEITFEETEKELNMNQ